MASFTFNQTSGTQLPTIDAKWTVYDGGLGKFFQTNGTYLTVSAIFATPVAAYVNGHGAAQLSRITLQAGASVTDTYRVSCQIRALATPGYELWQTSSTAWQVRRDGAFVSSGSHSENVTSANFTLEISVSAAGLVVGKINGTTYYSGVDATPITGGYPGFDGHDSGSLTDIRILDWTDGVVTGISLSSATKDGADVLAATAAAQIAASAATTDGADALAAASSAQVAASSASVDGADVLSAAVGQGNSASSATTDGLDALAAAVSIGAVAVAASSATTDGADALAASAALVVTVSTSTSDGADGLAAAAGVVVSAAAAITDGADSLLASEAPLVGVSSSATDGADVTSATASAVVLTSAALIDGADVMASNVGAVVAASSATTDSADAFTANVAPVQTGVSASSATTDGADVLATTAAPVVSASSATTDGADVVAASVGNITGIGVSSAAIDGADALTSSAGAVVSGSSATTDGADTLAASASPSVAASVAASVASVDGADGLAAAGSSAIVFAAPAPAPAVAFSAVIAPVTVPVNGNAPLTLPVKAASSSALLIPPFVEMVDSCGRPTQAWYLFFQKQFNLVKNASAQQSQQQEVPVLFGSEETEELMLIPGPQGNIGPQGNTGPQGNFGLSGVPAMMDWSNDADDIVPPIGFLTGPATTAVLSSAFVAGAGTAVTSTSTFDNYTIAQVVKALKNNGILT